VRYRPIDQRGWRMAMGLRPLDEATWFEIDHRRASELALKADLLARVPETVVATTDEGRAASDELEAVARQWWARFHPETTLSETTGHPVVRVASWVQEDLCVLERSDAWRLSAACVCFPSRWDLRAKIGQTLDTIHDPVPGYRPTLAGPTTALFDRLTPEKSFWRLNWTLIDNPDLHQPISRRRPPEGDLTQWFFRVERQTLRALPNTGAVVFTIRNYVQSLAELAESDEFMEHLLLGIETAPPEMREYKGWVGVAEVLRATTT
jgi:hypothetical protein